MVEEVADDAHLGLPNLPVALGGGGRRQYRWQCFAGHGAARSQVGGVADAAMGIGAGDVEPVGQHPRQCASQLFGVGLLGELVDHRMFDGRQPASRGFAALQQLQPLVGRQRVERQAQESVDRRVEGIKRLRNHFPTTRTHV